MICRTGNNTYRKMCGLRKIAVILTALFGVLGFSFGDSPQNCDLVKQDFETTVKLAHLRFLEKPEAGKIVALICKMLLSILSVYFLPSVDNKK